MSQTPESAAAEPAISVRNVVVSYNGRRVLDGINLDIRRGETMVLLGGSGSGKSNRRFWTTPRRRKKSGGLRGSIWGCKSDDTVMSKLVRKTLADSPMTTVRKRKLVRLDAVVVAWLRQKGKGYQTRLNRLLRDAMLEDIRKSA